MADNSIINIFRRKYDLLEFEIECAIEFVSALLNRPNLIEKEKKALSTIIDDLSNLSERTPRQNCYLSVTLQI